MEPKVSVFMITYNHEKFIAEAIESVLNQDYENLELVIGEDCSTDNTREIVKSYKDRFPQKIKLILHDENQGIHLNTKSVIEQCDGEYVALIEGDDYWIDNQKLKKQIHFLENNPKYSICSHRAKILNQTEIPFAEYLPSMQSNRQIFDVYDIINGLYLPTASTVFRNKRNYHKLGWLNTKPFYIDRMFYLLNSMYGDIHFMNETMSVYRVHENAQWSVKQDVERIEALIRRRNILELFDQYTAPKYSKEISEAIKKCNSEILIEQVINDVQIDYFNPIKIKNILQKLFSNKPIYIFGASRGGLKAKKFLNHFSIKCEGFLDNDPKKWNMTFENLTVYNPSEFQYKDKLILIASEFFKEISQQLNELDLNSEKEYYSFLHLLSEKQELFV